eukprot:c21392_g1_i1 orf=147-476(+)
MATQVSPSMTSSLNPNAALFIPSSAQVTTIHHDDDADKDANNEVIMPEWDVEDFSPEWWTLVQTSPEFCEFWLHGYEANDMEDLLFFMQHENAGDNTADVQYADQTGGN